MKPAEEETDVEAFHVPEGVRKSQVAPSNGEHERQRERRPSTPSAWQANEDTMQFHDGQKKRVSISPGVRIDPRTSPSAAGTKYAVEPEEHNTTAPPRPTRRPSMQRQGTLSKLTRRLPSNARLTVSADFKRQANMFSKQLRQRDRDRVWVIDPRESMLLGLWDTITSLALVYTALVTPFEVGFLQPSTSIDGWFITNRLLDVIFLIDMALQFCVVYQQASERGSDDVKFVTERRKIVRHYVFGWFPLDVASILPSAFDIIPLLQSSSTTVDASPSGSSDLEAELLAEKLSGFRAIRALRLVKLVRLIRASRLISRWQARIGFSHSAITSGRIVLMMSLSAHWYACIFALQAVLHDDPAGTWLGLQGHCNNMPIVLQLPPGAPLPTPLQAFSIQCEHLTVPSFYLAALSWSAMIITGLGGTDYYPSQDNVETIIVTALVVLGALMWAKVLATFCDLATNSDPSFLEYRQAIDDLNRFCRNHGFAPELKRRLRQYFQQRKHVMLAKSASGVIRKMSTSLQIEVVMLVHSHWLDHIWFLRGAEPACLVQLALRMEPCVFSPGELPEDDHLYIIHRGIVAQGMRMLTSGKLWGEEMILPDGPSKQMAARVARCMTYVEVFSISRLVFFKVTAAFDNATRLVKRGATILKVRHGVVALVKSLRKKRDAGDGRGFLDMILDAADKSGTGTRATVNSLVGSEASGGAVTLNLIDDVAMTKSSVEDMKAQVQRIDTTLLAVCAGLNQLLEKNGLKSLETE